MGAFAPYFDLDGGKVMKEKSVSVDETQEKIENIDEESDATEEQLQDNGEQQEKMVKVKAAKTLIHEGKIYSLNEKLEVTIAHAKNLLKRGLIFPPKSKKVGE